MSQMAAESSESMVRRREAARAPVITALIYMGCIAGAEIVLVQWGPVAGTIVEAVLLTVLLSHFTLLTPDLVQGHVEERGYALTRALPVLALLPLLRILSLTM